MHVRTVHHGLDELGHLRHFQGNAKAVSVLGDLSIKSGLI
jgi:hypothetical protein